MMLANKVWRKKAIWWKSLQKSTSDFKKIFSSHLFGFGTVSKEAFHHLSHSTLSMNEPTMAMEWNFNRAVSCWLLNEMETFSIIEIHPVVVVVNVVQCLRKMKNIFHAIKPTEWGLERHRQKTRWNFQILPMKYSRTEERNSRSQKTF